MKRSTKKGFTIVELVIVIAIIAILAAVLIPTFASLIQKANESKDTQLVRNLNTALKTDGKEHKTMQDALDAAEAFGYDVGKINASATDNEILWDSVNDAFCYYNKDKGVEYLPQTELKDGKTPADYLLWKIYGEEDKLEAQTYSIYWNKAEAFPANTVLTVGFDAGSNTAITELNYNGVGTEQKVVIRTNGATALTVNAKTDTVYHYGEAASVDVQAIAGASYHVYGKVGFVKVTDGRAVVESTGEVITVFAAANTAKVDNNSGVIENAYAASDVTANGNQELAPLPTGMTEDSIKEAALYQYNAAVKVGDKYYTNLSDVFNKVATINGNGYLLSGTETIVFLKDIRDYGFRINTGSNITIDFNGHTYDILSGVGSPGTTNNGFQLLKDSTIVFKNGTLTSSKVLMLIQNYANLTLDNMVLDGRELAAEKVYTLSNNHGNVTIKDTTIYAKSTGVAFDVYSFGSYTGANVTLTGKSVVNGNIEVGQDANVNVDTLNLKIESGTINGTISVAEALCSKVSKKADLTVPAPTGYEWGTAENGYQKLVKKSS